MTDEGYTRLDEFIHGADNISLNGSEVTVLEKNKCNVYGNAVVAAGRAEWDLRIDFESFGGICIGIWRHDLRNKNDLSQLPLEEHFAFAENGYGYTNKTGALTHGGERKKYGARFRHGDVLTVALDLTARSLSYSINGQLQGTAYDMLPRGAYRLAVKLQFKEQKVTCLRLWTSLKDGGTPSVPSEQPKAAKKPVEPQPPAEPSGGGIDSSPEAPEPVQEKMSTQQAAESPPAEEQPEDSPPQEESKSEEYTATTESGDMDFSGPPPPIDQDADEDDEQESYPTNNTSPLNSQLAKLNDDDEDDEEEKFASDSEQQMKHERKYSMNDMRSEIQHQKHSSNSLSKEEREENTRELTPDVPEKRSRAGSAASKPAPAPPEPIIMDKKEDDGTDFFSLSGNNMNIEEQVVTCIRESKDTRHSAFGTQTVARGRMEWMIKIEKAHTIRIGVTGVTHTSNGEFSDSPYGYGYGDDGNIYRSGSFIEYGDGYKTGDIVGVYLDMDTGTLKFSINGVDQGDAFDELKTNEDDSVYGYRLAVSLQFRPHKLSLLESTLWSTERLSPRPQAQTSAGAGGQPRRLSWTNATKKNSDEDTDSSAKSKTGKKANGASKKGPKAKGASAKKTVGKKTSASASAKRSVGKKTPTGTKPKSAGGRTKPAGKSAGRAGAGKKSSRPASAAAKKKPAGASKPTSSRKKPAVSKPKPAAAAAKPAAKKPPKPKPAEESKEDPGRWTARANAVESFVKSGSNLRTEGKVCMAMNSIRDGNSAFGTLELKKNMKAQWDVKVLQGTMMALGVIQCSDKNLKTAVKYRKLLNGFFSNDPFGYAYSANDGGTTKNGRHKRYGEKYKSGDTISIILDLSTNKVSFRKNGTSQGIAYSNIPAGQYRLAVMLPKKMHKISVDSVKVWDLAK